MKKFLVILNSFFMIFCINCQNIFAAREPWPYNRAPEVCMSIGLMVFIWYAVISLIYYNSSKKEKKNKLRVITCLTAALILIFIILFIVANNIYIEGWY